MTEPPGEGLSSAVPADLQDFVDETETFQKTFTSTMTTLAEDWVTASAGNDFVTFQAPFDEADDVYAAWTDRAGFVASVREAFIAADEYDPDDPDAVLTVETSTVDAMFERSAEALIELGVDPDDAEIIAGATPELYDAVLANEISVDAAVEVAELSDGEQRNVLSTDLTPEEIVDVLDNDYGKDAKDALTSGHGYRTRVLMLDEETQASVNVSDALPVVLDGDETVSFEELQKRIEQDRAAIVERYQTAGMSFDEAQAAYDDLIVSVDFLAGDDDARDALDGGADKDSKPGDPDADNKFSVTDAQTRAIDLLEDDENPNAQRLWQRAIQGTMGTPQSFVTITDVDTEDAESFIDEHTDSGFDTDSAVAEIQALRRENPHGAASLEIAVIQQLDGEERQKFIDEMRTQVGHENTTFAILGQDIDPDFDIEQSEIDAETERILEESNKKVGVPPGHPGAFPDGDPDLIPTEFDPNEAEYQLNELAKTNPALALMVKQQLDGQLTPDQVAEVNRLIADSGFWDDVESAGNHPGQAVIGGAKNFANGFIFIGNVLIDTDITGSRDEAIPSFDLDNSAQRGGGNIGTIIEIGAAGKGLIKLGGRWFLRNGDEIVEISAKQVDEFGRAIDNTPGSGPGGAPNRVDLDSASPEVRRGASPRANAVNMQPNTTYVKSGYEFTTDHLGRPIKVEGGLAKGKSTRTAEQTKTGHLGNTGDEGGHLIGSQFKGPSDAFNLTPQTRALNRGKGSAWTKMERDWAKALDEGKDVKVNIQPKYNPGNTGVRPDSFEVQYTIDGAPFQQSFPNV